MDKNNYNNNEIDLKLTLTSYSVVYFYKGGQKTQLLEMSILPVFRIS